jgi:Kef-type K+ transport system membrane component KefB
MLFELALVLAVGLAGPALAARKRARVPVVVGEIALGVVVGSTGFGWVHPAEPALSSLATIGFGLVMLEAGSHVPLNDPALRVALAKGCALAIATGVVAVPIGLGIASLLGTGHGLLFAVLIASSSAALVLPALAEVNLHTPAALITSMQVALADTVCIVALPLVEDPKRAGSAALASIAVIAAGGAIYLIRHILRKRGLLKRIGALSKSRDFGLEL